MTRNQCQSSYLQCCSERNTSQDNHLSGGALRRNTRRKLHTRRKREEVDVTRGAPHRTPRLYLVFFSGKDNSCPSMLLVTDVWREVSLRRLMR